MAINNNQRLLFIECPDCYKDIPIELNNLLLKDTQKDEDHKNENTEIIECPICREGVISYLDDGDERFWGCGECGNIWHSRYALDRDICRAKKE
jgi:ribosomal protein S27AE